MMTPASATHPMEARMRFMRPMLLASLATALAGVTAVAAAERQPVHVLTVSLPDGSVEHIRYTGDVAPRIVIGAGDAATALSGSPAGLFDSAFGPDSAFAAFDRIAAEMDRQAATMLQQAMTAAPSDTSGPAMLTPAALASLARAPAGATSYSFVSSSSGAGTCSRSVEVTSLGDGKAPQVIRKASGDCGGGAKASPAPVVAAKPAPPSPDSI
jgi:hypothetical protein